MFLGDTKANVEDMIRKGRDNYTGPDTPAYGERNGRAVLSEEDVRWIRKHYKSGSLKYGQCALARKYGVSQSTIGRAVRREKWTHLS